MADPGQYTFITQTVLREPGVLRTNSPAPFGKNPHVPCPGLLPDGETRNTTFPFPFLLKKILSILAPFYLLFQKQHLFEAGRRGVGGTFSEAHHRVPPFSVFSSLFSYLISFMPNRRHRSELRVAAYFEGRVSYLHNPVCGGPREVWPVF